VGIGALAESARGDQRDWTKAERWHERAVAAEARARVLTEALREILIDTYWVDSHPGRAAKQMANAVDVERWKRWRAALSSGGEGA
jgi:hypothetical protein